MNTSSPVIGRDRCGISLPLSRRRHQTRDSSSTSVSTELLKDPHEARAMAARGGGGAGASGQSDYQSLPQTSDPTATGVPPSTFLSRPSTKLPG